MRRVEVFMPTKKSDMETRRDALHDRSGEADLFTGPVNSGWSPIGQRPDRVIPAGSAPQSTGKTAPSSGQNGSKPAGHARLPANNKNWSA